MSNDYRTGGFENRAYQTGQLGEYQTAKKLRWAEEDRARARRARILGVAASLGCGGWLVVLGVLAVGLLYAGYWAQNHPVQLTIIGILALAGTCLYLVGEWRKPGASVVHMAPPDAYRRAAAIESVTMALPSDARAIHAALPAARGRHYFEALQNGFIGTPARRKDDGSLYIEAPLPGQVSPSDVDLARFAQCLGVTKDRVLRGPEVPGMFTAVVLDMSPKELRAGQWPGLGAVTDWEAPMPLGVDDVGQPVTVEVAGRRALIVGMTGSGKTYTTRLFGLWAAGDPNVSLSVIDMKGSPKLLGFRDRAAFYHAGPVEPRLIAHLEAVRDDMRARYARMREGVDVIAEQGWVVVIIDEAHMLFPDKRGTALVEEIARLGREAGIGLVIGTQLPNKADLPTVINEQCDIRVCMKVADANVAGRLLGTYDVDPTGLPQGHGFLSSDEEVLRVASHLVEDDECASHLESVAPMKVIEAAERDRHGDVQDTTAADEREWLRDAADAFSGAPAMSWAQLAQAMGEPVEDVRQRLAAAGVRSRSVRLQGAAGTVRGVRFADVYQAVHGVAPPVREA